MELLVGNLISFVASVFMCLAAAAPSRRRVYILQLVSCVVLMLAQIVFGYPVAAITLAFSAVRNLLVLANKFTLSAMLSLVFLTALFATVTFSGAGIELLPVIASLTFTVGSYFSKGVIGAKIAFVFMLVIWAAYSFIIRDFSTGVTHSISAMLAIFSIISHCRELARKDRRERKINT